MLTSKPFRTRKSRLDLESLDQRVVPATVDLATTRFGNDGVADVVRVSADSRGIYVDVNEAERVYVGAPNEYLTVRGSDDSEKLIVSAGVKNGVAVHGNGGFNELHAHVPASVNATSTKVGLIVADGYLEYGWVGGNSRKVAHWDMDYVTAETGAGADNIYLDAVKTPTIVNSFGGGDYFRVYGEIARSTELNAGKGNDRFEVVDLDDIDASLSLKGDDGTDRLVVDDTTNTSLNEYTITRSRIFWDATDRLAQHLNYENLSQVNLLAGRGADRINVFSTSTATTVDAGPGRDEVYVGSDSLQLAESAPISQKLTLNAGVDGGKLFLNDRANPYVGGEVSGRYTVSNTGVTRMGPIIRAGVVRGVIPIVSIVHQGFQQLTLDTGHQDDRVRITAAGSPLITVNAGDGNDIVIGGASNDTINGEGGRDILIGRLGFDDLSGGDGEDILIGGTTTHDANDVKLRQIRSIWSQTDKSLSERKTLLAPLLSTSTVRTAETFDDLVGGLGADWIWPVPPIQREW